MKAEPRGKKISLEVPDALLKLAKQRALDDDTNLRTIVITALERYVGKPQIGKGKGGRHAR